MVSTIQKNQIKEGFADGYWEHYFRGDNNLLAKGNYKKSIRVGYWEYYYSSGELRRKEYFLR
jgi:antitoxin component YwqK of YwqJK toxin-antitoxin module